MNAGRGPVGKTAVVGVTDRNTNKVAATPVVSTDKPTLQGFVESRIEEGAKVYSDESHAYHDLPNHEAVRHSVRECSPAGSHECPRVVLGRAETGDTSESATI